MQITSCKMQFQHQACLHAAWPLEVVSQLRCSHVFLWPWAESAHFAHAMNIILNTHFSRAHDFFHSTEFFFHLILLRRGEIPKILIFFFCFHSCFSDSPDFCHPAVLYLWLYWPKPFQISFCFNIMFCCQSVASVPSAGGVWFFFGFFFSF